MRNEYKEVESQLRKSLEMWSEVMTESNDHGWGAFLDFTEEDVFNAVNIMSSICCNVGIKNNKIQTEKDADKVGKKIHRLLSECFGIDLKKLENN